MKITEIDMKYKFPFGEKDWCAVMLIRFIFLQNHLSIEKSELQVKQLKSLRV